MASSARRAQSGRGMRAGADNQFRSSHAARRTASAPTACARPGRRVISKHRRHAESLPAVSASPLQLGCPLCDVACGSASDAKCLAEVARHNDAAAKQAQRSQQTLCRV